MTSLSSVFRDVRTMPACPSNSSPCYVVLSGFARAWNIESRTSSTLKFCPESVKHGNPIKFRFLSSSLSGCGRKRGGGEVRRSGFESNNLSSLNFHPISCERATHQRGAAACNERVKLYYVCVCAWAGPGGKSESDSAFCAGSWLVLARLEGFSVEGESPEPVG